MAELLEWEAEFRLEPWGELRADLHTALGRHTMIQLWADKKGRQIELTDLMPQFRGSERAKPQRKSDEDIRAYLIGFTRMMGGEIAPGAIPEVSHGR